MQTSRLVGEKKFSYSKWIVAITVVTLNGLCQSVALARKKIPVEPEQRLCRYQENVRVCEVGKFKATRLAQYLGKKEIQSLLQKMVNKTYLIGFRYLGDPHDFFHGHFLFWEDKAKGRRPAAILYHTQESALMFHEADLGGKYDYLDPESRNWLQWVDEGRPIERAEKYLSEAGKTHAEFEGFREAHTVKPEMMDLKSLRLSSESVQWELYSISCEKVPSPIPDESDAIEIFLPENQVRVCLILK